MAVIVADVQTRAKKRYPDLDDGGTDTATLMQEVHDDILARVPIVLAEENLTALVVGTKTYAIDDSTLRVWVAYYIRSSSAQDDKKLTFTTERWLDLNRGRWRTAANGEPTYAYMTVNSSGARMLGFYKSPDTATSGSYPQVRLYVSRKQTLTTNLPTIIDEMDPYLHGIWWRYLMMWGRMEEADAFKKELYDPAVMKLTAKMQTFMAGNVPHIQPWIAQTAQPR